MKSWNRHIETTNAVRRYQNGEQQVLKVLVRRFHPVLIRAIRRQAGSGAPAEDIAQECWYAIIPQLENLKLKISFEVWAIAIARRKAIDWIRQEQRNRTKNQSLETEIKSRSLDTDEEDRRRGIAREWEHLQRRIQIVGFAIREWDFLAPTTEPAEASS
jgi:RNA polymerase sigma factor (sigma-70 family)